MPIRAQSPNRNRGHHWSARHKETKEWETWIRISAPRGWQAWNLIERTEVRRETRGGRVKWRIAEARTRERRRVTLIRRVPSRRNFCKDRPNLVYVTKPIHDALVRLGLLFDDSIAWLDDVTLEEVSADGTDSTVIRIERLGRVE